MPPDWDPLDFFDQYKFQPDSLFTEQNCAIQTCKDIIDVYCELSVFWDWMFLGSGTMSTMKYCTKYALYKGLL